MDYSFSLRTELCRSITSYIRSQGMSQGQAAEKAGIAMPRLSLVRKEKVEKLSIDFLLNLATNLGLKVNIEIIKEAA